MTIEIKHDLGPQPFDPVGPDRANHPYTQSQWQALMAYCGSLALKPTDKDGKTLFQFYQAYCLRRCLQSGIVDAEKIAPEIRDYMSQMVEGLKGKINTIP